jgi:hypothetical protein
MHPPSPGPHHRAAPTSQYTRASAALLLLVWLGSDSTAYAMPGFTRQTGQPCVACHVRPLGSSPGPFGRQPSLDNFAVAGMPLWPRMAATPFLASFTMARNAANARGSSTDRRRPADAARDAELRLYWAGEPAGYTPNNNPDARNPRNTRSASPAPAWTFPWSFVAARDPTTPASSGPSPFGEHGGLTADYVGRTINLDTAGNLDTTGNDATAGTPWIGSHWRVALKKELEQHFLQLGTYGAEARPSDNVTDMAARAWYQFTIDSTDGRSNMLSAHATIIHGIRSSDADVMFPGLHMLDAFRADVAYSFANTITSSIQYFRNAGAGGAERYGWPGSRPNSSGVIAGLAYLPWASTNSPIQPLNLKFAVQYVAYTSFDSITHGSGANGALYFSVWGALRF